MTKITESDIETAALQLLSALGYSILHGPEVAPDTIFPIRHSYSDVVLKEKLRTAIENLNPQIPQAAREEALRKVLRTDSPDLITNNYNFHRMLVDGVNVEYRREDGSIAGDTVWLFDFKHPANNDFTAINQFTSI